MAWETVLGAGLILLGLYGSLANAFQVLIRWRSGRLRDYSLRLAVAFVVTRLGWAVTCAGVLLGGLHAVSESVWRTDLHTLDLWGHALLFVGLLIAAIGSICEKPSPLVTEIQQLWALPTWDSETVAHDDGERVARDDDDGA